MRQRIAQSRRWIIKVGSSLLTNNGQGLDHALIADWCSQIAGLTQQGLEVVVVSSGSIAAGMNKLGWQEKPAEVHRLQAAAAVGQMGLIQAWESGFKEHGIRTAQVLLTHDDLANRRRYLNARSTLRTLVQLGVVPIVNENDTVTTDEIRLGDNDTLGALVAILVEADVLALLTDQHGLYDRDPRHHADARLLERADANDPATHALAGPAGSKIGSGGMLTKVQAAARAADAGTTTLVAWGKEPQILTRLAAGEEIGTMMTSRREIRLARKQWLASHLRARGRLHLDEGACRYLLEHGASLLPVGVTHADGEFQRGELVSCHAPDGNEIARGLVNYGHTEVEKLCRVSSREIEAVLGYSLEPELIHRDNLIVRSRV